MAAKTFDYTGIKRQSIKNKIVRCPNCGKMARKGNLWGDHRMYVHGGEIVGGFPVIKEKCMVEEVRNA